MTAFAPSVKYEPSSFPYGELSGVWTRQSMLRLSVIGDATYARTGTSTQVELARHNEVRYASDEPPTYLMTGSVSSHPKCQKKKKKTKTLCQTGCLVVNNLWCPRGWHATVDAPCTHVESRNRTLGSQG